MKLLKLFAKGTKTLVTGVVTGGVKPLPLSGIVNELGKAVIEIKTQKNYERLIKLAAYLVMGGLIWWVIYRGLATFDQVQQILDLINQSIG